MVLNQGIRDALPRSARKRFAAWVAEQPWLLLDFAERAAPTVSLTREALRKGVRGGILNIQRGGLLVDTRLRPPNSAVHGDDVVACTRATRLIGTWLRTTEVATAFALLGVRP